MLPRLVRTANFKLAMLYALVFSASVIMLGAGAYLDVRYSLEEQMRLHVKAEIDQLMHDYRDDGFDELRHDIRERMESRVGQRLRYSVSDSNGRVIFDRLKIKPNAREWHTIHQKDTRLLAYSTPLRGGYLLTVAADMRPILAVEQAMLHACLLALLGTVALGVVGGLLVSRRFLRRVDMLGRTAEAIGRGNLHKRIPISSAGDDFDQLAATINHMLERIEVLVSEMRHVTNGIAHDLRTPLSQLRCKLEAMPESSETEEAIALLDRTLATFSAMLQLAELESGARKQGFQQLDFSELLGEVVEIYEPLVSEHGTLATHIAPGLHIEGNATLLRQLLANLIENTLRHVPTPLALTIRLAREGARTVLEISDNGPGIPAANHVEALRPFVRYDASRSRPGNGLGLSIVAAIARLHDARVELADANPGLTVRVSWPPQANY